jgi:membrane protease YdiL (CAAX protease family)
MAFGVVVAAGMFGLYYGFLRDSSVFGNTPAMVRRKLEEFGLDTPAAFFAFAGFLCVIHSFLEEYYWRWFVFGQLRRVVPLGSAILVSSFAFMAHHVIVLNVYFPGQFWTATLPFSLCVAGGGGVWACLYQRSGSLLGPWLGHLLIDAAILVIGYDLVFGG